MSTHSKKNHQNNSAFTSIWRKQISCLTKEDSHQLKSNSGHREHTGFLKQTLKSMNPRNLLSAVSPEANQPNQLVFLTQELEKIKTIYFWRTPKYGCSSNKSGKDNEVRIWERQPRNGGLFSPPQNSWNRNQNPARRNFRNLEHRRRPTWGGREWLIQRPGSNRGTPNSRASRMRKRCAAL